MIQGSTSNFKNEKYFYKFSINYLKKSTGTGNKIMDSFLNHGFNMKTNPLKY